MAVKRKLVALISTDVFTPYKKDEVFCVPEDDAEKLLQTDRSKNEYGVPRYPKVKVRLFDPERDGDVLLAAGSLNLDDHNRLLSKLHPERPKAQVRMTQYQSEITDMLDDIDPARIKEYARDESNKIKVGVASKEAPDETGEVNDAPQGTGLRRGRPGR